MIDSSSQSVSPAPLAVVGLSCLFPKAADVSEFWSNIRQGVDAITEVPSTHWRPDDYFDKNPKTPDMTYAQRGGFLSPVAFDPLEFGIAPSNLEAIDTSQLLSLVAAKRALIDAGYGDHGKEFSRERVSCILGVTGTLELVVPLGARLGHPKWRQALKEAGVADDVAADVIQRIGESYVPWQENSFPGLLGNVVAGRIANRLDLGGTNCVVDAACASSLSALHLAASELWSGRSDMVLTGGVDTFNDIFMYMCFSKTPALSATGDSRPFGDNADGTMLGEGVGILVLKRLADAQRDGDRIYALIRGIGTSSDGAGNAVYAPKKDGQIRCLQAAYRHAGVSPETIELIEGHGTGTKVGDAIEAAALNDVFRASGRTGRWCALGSVKSQIGHTKAAAGAAGLFKAILALQKRVLPPTIKVSRPQDVLLADDAPLYLNSQPRPWLSKPDHPRRAGVSAFGFGGSNFHCVLEEAPIPTREADWNGDVIVAAFSAESLPALQAKLTGWNASGSWGELRHRTAATRAEFSSRHTHRLVLVWEQGKSDVAATIREAIASLERYRDKSHWSTPDGISYASGGRPGQLAVLFPGQGSQSVGMLRELACRFPVMQDVLADADLAFAENAEQSPSRLSDYIYPIPAWSDEERREQETRLRATEIAQPAIGAVSLGALAVLQQFGITAELTAGHSYGELTALCVSERYQPRELYRLSSLRGQLMAEAQSVEGGMLVVGAPLSQVEAAIAESAIDLVIANRNSPNQVVLSGRLPDIERAVELFSQRNLRGKRLPVAAAFHSPLVASASEKFRTILEEVAFQPSKLPVFGNTHADVYPEDPAAARDLLAGQLAKPVEFVRQIERMYDSGARCFLEVGPGGVLTGLVGSILSGRDVRTLALDASGGKRSGMLELANVLAQLSVAGYAVNLSAWDPAPPAPPAPTDRLTIPISGANYVRPRTSRPPLAVTVEPLPSVARSVPNRTVSAPTPSPAAVMPTRSDASLPASHGGKLPLTTAPASLVPALMKSPVSKSAASPSSTPAMPVAPAPAVLPTTAPESAANSAATNGRVAQSATTTTTTAALPSSLALLQKMQAETARLHRQFLEGQEFALRSLAALTQNPTTQRLMPAQPAVVTAVVEQSLAAEQTLPRTLEQAAPASPRPTQSSQPSTMAAPAPAPLPVATTTRAAASVPRVPATSAVIRPTPVSDRPATVPAVAAAPAAPSLAPQILAVVAEKTGYPVEMLKPGMSLDHDLGIDSIKRVEILSAVQEQLPNLPTVTPEQLQTLHRLQDILDLLGAASAATMVTPVAAPVVSAPSLAPQILAVVAEKTGYPVEMLKPGMSLDHDLGIDSIKRVEILSAVQEQLPNLPTVTPEQLQTLHRLQDILDLLGAASAATMVTPVVAPVVSAPSLAPQILAVVAEKTGYPVEMLKPGMSLDHDLGIDSIKRVEILSAVQEQLPNLPTVTPEQLQTLHRLQDILDLLGASVATNVAAVATATPAAPSLAPQILAVVAEKTGYPVEMLKPGMSLDHDLGIDSIKRVEILSAVQEQLPNLPTVTPEQLQTLHRLQDILDLLGAANGSVSAAVNGSHAVAGPAIQPAMVADVSTADLLCGIVRAQQVDAPANRSRLRLPADGEFWVTDDGSELGRELTAALTKRGLSAMLVDWNQPQVPAAGLSGLALLAPSKGMTRDHLWRAIEWTQMAGATLKRASELGQTAVFATCSRLDGAFGCGANSVIHDPVSGALAGLAKTVQQEWSGITAKALDLAKDVDLAETVSAIADELIHSGPVEVGWTAGGRQELQIVERTLADRVAAANGATLLPGDLVLVTGGGRGVTAAAAIAVTQGLRPTIALLGRSALPAEEPAYLQGVTEPNHIKQALATHGAASTPRALQEQCQRILSGREILATLRQLKECGATVEYCPVDVRDASAVAAVVSQLTAQYGPVRGLIHGAGVLADHRIEQKTAEQFDAVYSTKIVGLEQVLQAVDPQSLRALVLFSSFTARYGRTGQVDYAMSNEILNKQAQQWQRRYPQCRVVAFNWGPWDGGMVQGGLRALFAQEGVGLIPLAAGAQLVAEELRCPPNADVEIVVLGPGSTPLWDSAAGKSSTELVTGAAATAVQNGAEPIDLGVSAGQLDTNDFRVDFTREISLAHAPYLHSHVLGQKAVLPVAMVVEWLAHAVLHRNPGLEFLGFTNLRVFQGVRLAAEDQVTLQVLTNRPRRVDGQFIVSAVLCSQSANREIRHAMADMILGQRQPRPAGGLTEVSTDNSVTIANPYELLFHGPHFQGITDVVTCSSAGIVIRCRTAASPEEWQPVPLRSDWVADPLVIDTALQALILWSRTFHQLGSLPSAIARYEQYQAAFPSGDVEIRISVTEHNTLMLRADAEFIDAQGQLIARLTGVQHVMNESLAAAFLENAIVAESAGPAATSTSASAMASATVARS